jgi:hypothetical protein
VADQYGLKQLGSYVVRECRAMPWQRRWHQRKPDWLTWLLPTSRRKVKSGRISDISRDGKAHQRRSRTPANRYAPQAVRRSAMNRSTFARLNRSTFGGHLISGCVLPFLLPRLSADRPLSISICRIDTCGAEKEAGGVDARRVIPPIPLQCERIRTATADRLAHWSPIAIRVLFVQQPS